MIARRYTPSAGTNPDPLDHPPVIDVDTVVIIVDLSNRPRLNTADFAKLVLLRRRLLNQGRDLRITGMTGQTLSVYEISRLFNTLPLIDSRSHRTSSAGPTGKNVLNSSRP